MNQTEEKKGFIRSLIGKAKLFLKHFFRAPFWLSPVVFWLMMLNIFSNLVTWLIPFFFLNRLDGKIILHYNVYFGVDKIGNRKEALVLPLIGTILFLLNVFLAAFFYKNKERIAAYILLLAALMGQASLLIAVLSLVLINY